MDKKRIIKRGKFVASLGTGVVIYLKFEYVFYIY